jgi:hypothetical protein
MSLQSAIRDHLRNDTAIAAIVGTRVYQNTASSKAAVPYIVVNVISQQPEHHLGGVSGIRHARAQIDSYESTSALRGVLAAAISARCDGWAETRDGEMGAGNLDVRSMLLDSEGDLYETPENGSEEGLFRNRADYFLSYKP